MANCNKPIKRLVIHGAGVFIFLCLWEALPALGVVNEIFLPRLSSVLALIVDLSLNGELLTHVVVSLWRVLTAGAITALTAIPIGIYLATSGRHIYKAMGSLFQLLAHVNPLSTMPLFVLFFGVGELAKIAVLVWVSLWPTLHCIVDGVDHVNADIVSTARSLGASRWIIESRILLPSIASSIFVGIRTSLGLSFVFLIVAEMIGANAGLGWMVHNAGMLYLTTRIYAAGVAIVLCGILLNNGLRCVESRVFFWESTGSKALTRRPWGARTHLSLLSLLLFSLLSGGIFVRHVNAQAALVRTDIQLSKPCPCHRLKGTNAHGGQL